MAVWRPAGGFAPEDADDGGASEQQEIERYLRDYSGREADDQKSSLPGERADERLGSLAADAVVDDVGTLAAGQLRGLRSLDRNLET